MAAAARAPEPLVSLGSRIVPALADPRASAAARVTWPNGWLTVNANVCPLAPASFYDLRPDVASLYEPLHRGGRGRVYSYGVAQTPGLRFEPVMAQARSDVWLYYLDRQALLLTTPTLDGLDSAFDLDSVGGRRPGSTFTADEAVPERFRECHRRLRGAAVR